MMFLLLLLLLLFVSKAITSRPEDRSFRSCRVHLPTATGSLCFARIAALRSNLRKYGTDCSFDSSPRDWVTQDASSNIIYGFQVV